LKFRGSSAIYGRVVHGTEKVTQIREQKEDTEHLKKELKELMHINLFGIIRV